MKKVILMIATLFIVGCASTIQVVNQEGIPVRNYDIHMTNPATAIKTSFYIQRQVEASQDSIVPEYYNLFTEANIPMKNTKGFFAFLRVVNPKHQTFVVTKTFRYKKAYSWSLPTMTTTEVYRGKDADKTWQIPIMMEDGVWGMTVEITLPDGTPIVSFGEFKYNVK